MSRARAVAIAATSGIVPGDPSHYTVTAELGRLTHGLQDGSTGEHSVGPAGEGRLMWIITYLQVPSYPTGPKDVVETLEVQNCDLVILVDARSGADLGGFQDCSAR